MVHSPHGIAVFDYTASQADELSVKVRHGKPVTCYFPPLLVHGSCSGENELSSWCADTSVCVLKLEGGGLYFLGNNMFPFILSRAR